ncbi:hypothetical protein JL722_13127 [Aureococcus anophagefferens]|nr:hypothetical protein JL722_13127 [Aureococcus anophagefferens]
MRWGQLRWRAVALACAVARVAAAAVVIDGTTCPLTTGEVRQLDAAKNDTRIESAAPCVLYDTAAAAPPADVVELTVVQAGPSQCMPHLAGAKVAVDTLNALNDDKGFAVGVAGDTFVRLRLVTILTAAEGRADYDAFHDNVTRAMLASDGFADAYGATRYLIGSCNKGPFADAEKWAAEAAGVILMAQIGADSTYEEGLANLFGMHLSSYSYSVPVLQQMRRSGARKIAVVTSTHSNFFVTTCDFGKEYAVGNVTVASTTQDEADLELVYDFSFDPKADDDGDGVANRVDVEFLDGVATGVCDSGADVFMACVQTDEAEVLVAKWQALECVPDAVWLTCAGWGAATRGESDARNYAAGGSQVDVAMPYSDEFFGTIEALVDAGEAAFGYRFDYDYVSSYACVYVLYRALRARYANEAVDAAGLAAELADVDGYAQLRANLARLEALETVFGPVGFDEVQRNAGRNPGAVQPLPNAADGGFALRCVGPIEAAETQYVYPAPAALPCPLNRFANASGACFLCDNECTRCPVGSTIHDPALVDGAGAASVAPPFELLRLKNILASEEKPFNLLAVLEFAPRDAEVPLVVEVQLLFDHLLPLFAHTHVLYSALVDDSEDDDPVTVVVGGVDDAAAGDGVECGACGLFEQAVVDAPAHFPDTDEPRLQA